MRLTESARLDLERIIEEDIQAGFEYEEPEESDGARHTCQNTEHKGECEF